MPHRMAFLNICGYAAVLFSPGDLIDVDLKRFVFKRSFIPDPHAGKPITFGLIDQTSSDGILVGVMNALHEHPLTGQQPGIRMPVPKRILVTPGIFLMPEFLQRNLVTFFLEKIDHLPCGDAVNKALDLGWFFRPVGY
jgi:hypothetical protein